MRKQEYLERVAKKNAKIAYFVEMTDAPTIPGDPYTSTLITKFPNGGVHPDGFATFDEAVAAADMCQQIENKRKEHATITETLRDHDAEIQRAEDQIKSLLDDIHRRKTEMRRLESEQSKLPTPPPNFVHSRDRQFRPVGPTSRKGGAKVSFY